MNHPPSFQSYFFFFNDTATTEIYTLSLHDALPICGAVAADIVGQPLGHALPRHAGADRRPRPRGVRWHARPHERREGEDRKSTRLNSSHLVISYAVFCLKKKKIRNDDVSSDDEYTR